MRRLTATIIPIAAAALATAGVALASSAHTSAASTVVNTKHTSLGTILVNGAGDTLYLDVGDKPPHFACTGACVSAWPLDKAVGKLMAKGAAKQADLGSVKGPGGVKMVTYAGHPLYTFTSDTKPGAVTGEGKNGFYVVGPNGAKITHAPTTTTTTTTTSTSS